MLSLDASFHILNHVTPAAAGFSGAVLLCAMLGDRWLGSEERVQNPAFRNGSSQEEYLVKRTYSGLFNLCFTQREYLDYLIIILVIKTYIKFNSICIKIIFKALIFH